MSLNGRISGLEDEFSSLKERDQYRRKEVLDNEQELKILANPDFVPVAKALLTRWAEDLRNKVDPMKDERWVELNLKLSKINGAYPNPCQVLFRDRTLRPLALDMLEAAEDQRKAVAAASNRKDGRQ